MPAAFLFNFLGPVVDCNILPAVRGLLHHDKCVNRRGGEWMRANKHAEARGLVAGQMVRGALGARPFQTPSLVKRVCAQGCGCGSHREAKGNQQAQCAFLKAWGLAV